MKKITLFFLLMSAVVSAQTTFDLDWEQGINGSAASLTIAVGDIVRWTWANGSPHSVTSLAGSQEDFDSGVQTGEGFQFSQTFTQAGTNPYQCDVHPGSMFGTITVEATMSVEDKFYRNIQFYPNPVTDELTVFSLYKLDRYEIYDITGKRLQQSEMQGNLTRIQMSDLQAGLYFVKLTSGELTTTLEIVKN